MSLDFEVNSDAPITSEDFLKDKADEKRRRKEERRRRKQYKFSDKKHSRPGIAATVLAVLAISSFVIAVILATKAAGEGGREVGILGAVGFVLSLAGILCGLLAFRQTDVYYRFAWIGLIASGIIWLILAVMIVAGL